jgi:hypothetical protein
MKTEEKRMMCEGDPKPDIVKEGKACLMVLVMIVCAILVLAAVGGVFYWLNELVKSLC